MNHADASDSLIGLCRGFPGRSAGLSVFHRRLPGLRLAGLRPLLGMHLPHFHWRAGLLRGSLTVVGGLGVRTERKGAG